MYELRKNGVRTVTMSEEINHRNAFYTAVTGKGEDEIEEAKRRLSVWHNYRKENGIYEEKWV